MSVSGFKINNTVEKYNYADLDNIAVQTGDIVAGAVTTPKIADDSVTPSKISGFEGAGITNVTYTTLIDTTSVTTSQHDKTYPWAILSSVTADITHRYAYRITFDGVEYVINGELWRSSVRIGKGIGFIGNATLWGDTDGFILKVYDVPFLITTGMDENGAFTEANTYIFTPIAGTHTVKVELITYSFTQLPNVLLDGTIYDGLVVLQPNTTSYSSYSIGGNAIITPRGNIAFGFYNTVSGNGARVFGNNNTVSGASATAIGNNNTASGEGSLALCTANTSSGTNSSALGNNNTASGVCAFASGNNSVASGVCSFTSGVGTIANHMAQYALGTYNVADNSSSSGLGNHIEIIGNGTGNNARSNARTLDWSGNESLAGSITLGKGTADEVTLSAAQLKEIMETVLGSSR